MKTMAKCYLAALSMLLSSTFVSATDGDSSEVETQHGKLIWADLYTGDVNSSIEFYTKTFNWTVKKFGENNDSYHLLYDGKKAVAGILARAAQRNKTETALWIGSISTDNVSERAKIAAANNATVLLNAHDFALYGKRAVIVDPQGGVVAFLDISKSEKALQKMTGKWDWAQLFSVDTKKAADFYQNTFDFDVDEVAQSQNNYYLSQQEQIRASIVKLPKSFEQRDRWVNFIEVANLNQLLLKAIKNGAEVIYQPKGSDFAIIADPNGALLGLTQQESE